MSWYKNKIGWELDERLKNCPLCGKEVAIGVEGNEHTRKRVAKIKCHYCNLEIRVGAVQFNMSWIKEKVREKWNKRV